MDFTRERISGRWQGNSRDTTASNSSRSSCVSQATTGSNSSFAGDHGNQSSMAPSLISDPRLHHMLSNIDENYQQLWYIVYGRSKRFYYLMGESKRIGNRNNQYFREANEIKNLSDYVYERIYQVIFRRKNPNPGRFKPIDLHGLRRKEAFDKFKQYLKIATKERWEILRIDAGKGKNSRGNVPVLHNSIAEHLETNGISYSCDTDDRFEIIIEP